MNGKPSLFILHANSSPEIVMVLLNILLEHFAVVRQRYLHFDIIIISALMRTQYSDLCPSGGLI